jgi:hypothetical protein
VSRGTLDLCILTATITFSIYTWFFAAKALLYI